MPHFGELQVGRQDDVQTMSVGASPATVSAPRDGMFIVAGGTLSVLEFGRNGVFVGLGVLGGAFPARRGDQIRITYLVAPSVKLI